MSSTLAGLLEADPSLDAESQLALLGVSYEDVMAELSFRRQQKIAAAYRQQTLAAKRGGERRILRAGEVGGETRFAVHPIFYHYWGQRLGYECWDDDQFVREFLRDNPAARVKNVSDRVTIVRPEFAKVPPHSAPNTPARRGPIGRRGRWAA